LVNDEPYPDLLQQKGGSGFPYLVVLDATGDVLATHSYDVPSSVEAFLDDLRAARDFQALRAKASAGDATARVEVFLRRLDLGISFPEASQEMAELRSLPEMTAEKAAAARRMLVDLEFEHILNNLPDSTDQDELIGAAGVKVLAMKKAGRIPEGDTAMNFWGILMSYAEFKKDLDLLDATWADWKSRLDPANSRDKRLIEMVEARVASAKGK